jgi:hypothetical protein
VRKTTFQEVKMSISNSKKQSRIPHALAGMIGAMALSGAGANAAQSAGGEQDCSPAAMQAGESEGSRAVYVGPRHNVRKRVGADSVSCEAESDVEAKTVYVGPRHSIRRTVR